jgi:hypothetical protein
MSDFLAVISVQGGGGTYERSPLSRQDAADRCLRLFMLDWGKMVTMKKGDRVQVMTHNVEGHDAVSFETAGAVTDNVTGKAFDSEPQLMHCTV